MPSLDLKIVRDNDEHPWPDLEPADIILLDPATPLQVAVFEHGMMSGKPSVAMRINLEDGRTVVAETSMDLWIGLTCAMRGAVPDAFAGGPLAEP